MALFITFEGPEGCGKTTQVRLLGEWLSAGGHDVLVTHEPGGTRISGLVRQIVLDPAHTEMRSNTEVLLFSAARAQIVGEVLRPHLERDGIVLCDRFADSTIAYQGYGKQLPLHELRIITHFATGGLRPDLTFYLDISAEEGLQRKRRGDLIEWNRMEQLELEFHQRVHVGYQQMIAAEPARWVCLDARHPIEEIQTRIRSIVRGRLPTP